MSFLTIPFFTQLEKSKRILLAGAGGGFDIFCGLPLYFGLREAGKEVCLANLSFANLEALNTIRLHPALVEITADTLTFDRYFPELYLSRWFREERDQEVPIYCFENTGVVPLTAAYQTLVKYLDVDTIILVDGGTDSLMRGDEAGLGTPQEDVASLVAVSQLNDIKVKLLACLGFGVDSFHGVCHAQFLESVAALIQQEGFLGSWSLTSDMPAVQRYREAAEYVFQKMPDDPSIVSSSVLSAVKGHFGDYHATHRTSGSRLFINPLMSLYWTFEVGKVVDRLLYRKEVLPTRNYIELSLAIKGYRTKNAAAIKPWVKLPM